MSKLFKFMSVADWLLFLLNFCFLGAYIYCNLSLPEYLGAIVGNLQAGAVAGNLSAYWTDILINGGFMLLMVVGMYISRAFANYLSSHIVTGVLAKTRRELFKSVNNFSMSEINKFSIASLITRSTNDITQLQEVLIMILNIGLTAPVTAIVAVFKIINLSSGLSVVTAISVVVLLLMVVLVFAFVVPKFNKMQTLTDRINLVTRENLTGLKVVRANAAEELQEQKFEKENKSMTKTLIFVNKIMSIIQPGISLIMSGTSLALVWLGAYLMADGIIDYQVLSVFTQYALQIITAFMMASMLFVMIPRAIVSGKRIKEVLDTKTSILDGEGVTTTQTGSVEFKDVSFKYPGADDYVLKNISFKAEKGQTIAFIGSTGSGKSTLINLIPRFYDCTQGEVFVDGENVRDFKLHDLHNRIGYVPQQGVLFSGSIRENIKYGNENATDEEVEKALKIAQASFVFKKDEGLDAHISQGGKNVSGGQKQRLSIARALVRNPEILIFDDSFSALDYKTDKTLRKALEKNTKNVTKLIVAQRIGTIRNADMIIVLNEGEMVGKGTHDELLSSCPVYKEIALSQLKQEEL